MSTMEFYSAFKSTERLKWKGHNSRPETRSSAVVSLAKLSP